MPVHGTTSIAPTCPLQSVRNEFTPNSFCYHHYNGLADYLHHFFNLHLLLTATTSIYDEIIHDATSSYSEDNTKHFTYSRFHMQTTQDTAYDQHALPKDNTRHFGQAASQTYIEEFGHVLYKSPNFGWSLALDDWPTMPAKQPIAISTRTIKAAGPSRPNITKLKSRALASFKHQTSGLQRLDIGTDPIDINLHRATTDMIIGMATYISHSNHTVKLCSPFHKHSCRTTAAIETLFSWMITTTYDQTSMTTLTRLRTLYMALFFPEVALTDHH